LLHILQEKTSVKAKIKHALQAGHIVVAEGKFVHCKGGQLFVFVLVANFSAKIVYFDHFSVIHLQEFLDVRSPIPIHRLHAIGRKTTRHNSISDVGQIEVELARIQSLFICANQFSNPVRAKDPSAIDGATLILSCNLPVLLLSLLHRHCSIQ
jgi:hypothetical protein